MTQQTLKYTGGISNCPNCGCTELSTGVDISKVDKKVINIHKWYHRCIKCGYKIYFNEKKENHE